MPVVPIYYYRIPTFQLRVNGRPLAVALNARIDEVIVDDHVDAPSMFTFVISAAEDQANRIPWLEDYKLFAIGDVVAVGFGYEEPGKKLGTLLIGEVTTLEPEFFAGQLPRLTVRGYDRRHRLLRGRKNRTFLNQKDSDIVRQVAQTAGLSVQAEDSVVVREFVMQADQNDWEFLHARAGLIDFELLIEDRLLKFRPRRETAAPAASLTMGKEITQFYLRQSSVGQVTEVTARARLPTRKTSTIVSVTGDKPDPTKRVPQSGAMTVGAAFGEATEAIICPIATTEIEAKKLAEARLREIGLSFVQGEAVCAGNEVLRAGSSVKIEGIGRRYSGNYYVWSAKHRYDQDGYSTHLKVLRSVS